jgi:hypothetical protein
MALGVVSGSGGTAAAPPDLVISMMIAVIAAAASAPDGELPNPLAVVTFASGSAELDAADRRALRSAAEWLARHPRRVLVLEGHADPRGDPAMNLRLSQDRNDAVRDGLIALGVEPTRLAAVAYGEAEAPATRRVVINGSEPFSEPAPGPSTRPRRR